MIRYFDASALAKRYVRETGSADVARWFREAKPATSRLAWIEIASTAARRVRDGTMTPARAARVERAADAESGSVIVVELTESCATEARRAARRHGLRAGDAVHLASALELGQHARRAVEFVCYDVRLAAAARAEGLSVLGAE